MAFQARILADSLAPSGHRLTTFEATYPRCIHSEFMTHRMISRNAASSRAIPIEKMIARVLEDPFIPIYWGANQKGMQAAGEISSFMKVGAEVEWLKARDNAIDTAHRLLDMGLHKQIVNRVLEPWMWITVIASATSWTNFFGLRVHKDAEPHFQKIAGMMKDAYEASEPRPLGFRDWHLPLFGDCGGAGTGDEAEASVRAISEPMVKVKVSTGRCARVSYLTHDGVRDMSEDVGLHDRLMNANPGHWSPFEHPARAEIDPGLRSGNFVGWTQYRKLFEQEHIGGRMP